MTRWYTPKNGPLLNVESDSSINSLNDHLFIGSLGSARVIKFKAFVKDYKLNLSSNIEEKKDPMIHNRVYVATTGDWSWNISFDIPARNIEESKRNLAKVMELQKMTLMNFSGVDWKRIKRTETSWIVHYKNLICHSMLGKNNELEPTGWEQLLKKGVHVWCEEVKYTPDMDMGFFIDLNGTYPKNITLNLTLNLRNSEKDIERWSNSYKIPDKQYYINSFNLKGQYTADDALLTPFGVSLIDKPTTANIKTAKDLNQDCNGEQNFFYISLPYSTRIADLQKGADLMGGNSEDGVGPKFLLFKGFLEKFETSQKVENTVTTTHAHTQNPIKKHNETTKNDDYDYVLTINVPSSSIEEARRNLGKLQWLIRMYFTKNQQDSLFNENDIPYNLNNQKVRVFLPGMIQKPAASSTNVNYNYAIVPFYHNASIALEFTKLDITFDNDMGFFRSDDTPVDEEADFYVEQNSLYPKSYSISMNFSMEAKFNYNFELTQENKFAIFSPNEPGSEDKETWGIWNGEGYENFPIGSIFNQPESPPTLTFQARTAFQPTQEELDQIAQEAVGDLLLLAEDFGEITSFGAVAVTQEQFDAAAREEEAAAAAARKLLNPNDE